MISIDVDKLRDQFVINEISKLKAEGVLLDAGAGEQKYKKYCRHLKYISQDFNEYDGKGNGSGLQTGAWDVEKTNIVSDITNIPLPDASVDAILCTEVFEHIPDPLAAVREFGRLLKKDGIAIITAPFCSMTHFAPYHFATGFNKYWYQNVLEKNGFEIVSIQSEGNYFRWLGQEAMRIDEICYKYCNIHLSALDKIVRRYLLKRLSMFSECDKGSEELLCYEYYVKAVKI